MAGTLDVGTLQGGVEFEDKTSATLDILMRKVEGLEAGFGGLNTGVSQTAQGFLIAEVAMKAFEKVMAAGIQLVEDFTTRGAAIADVEDNFENLANQAGRLGATLLGALREGTHNTITDFELMKIANQNLAAGLELTDEQYKTVAESAFALSQATGEDMTSALNKVNDALLTGRTRGLQVLTGRIDLVEAEKALAASLGTTVERLTDEEKLQASRAATLEKLTEITGRLGEQTDGLDEKIAQVQTSFSNWYDTLLKTVASSPSVIKAFDTITTSITAAFGGDGEAAIQKITGAIDYFADRVTEYAPKVVDAFVRIKDWAVNAWEVITNAAATYGPTILKWLGNIKDFVVDTANAAKDTWDSLPEWFRKAAGEAALYGTAAVLTVKATNSMVSSIGGLIGRIPDLATTISGGKDAVELLNKGLVEMGFKAVTLTQILGPLAIAIGGVTAALFAWEGASASTGVLRDLSEGFEYAALRIQGYSEAQADAMIGTQRANQEYLENEERLAEIRDRLGESTRATKENEAALIEQSNASKLSRLESDLRTAALKRQEEQDRRTAEEIKKFGEAMEEAELRSKPLSRALEDLDGNLVEAAKYYLSLGLSAEKTATLLGTTAGVIERIKEVTEKQAAAVAKVNAAYQAQVEVYAELNGHAKAFDKVMSGVSSTIIEQAKHMLGLGATSEQLSKAFGITSAQADALTARFGSVSSSANSLANYGLPSVGSALDKVADKVRALNGEWETLEEHQRRQSSGNSITYDLTTQEGLDYYKQMNTAATFGKSDAQIIAEARKGKTLQQFFQEGSINPYGRFTAFAEGGVVTQPTFGVFGEAGPEAIIPLDKWDGMGGGPVIYNTFNVNGTGREVADTVASQLMTQLKLRRRFGSA